MPLTIKIVPAQEKTKKRYTAIFRLHKGGPIIKITHFGQRGGKTYIDEGNKEKRKNYIARHEVREKKFYTDPQRAATLSRFITWGEHKSLLKNIEAYKKKYNLE